MTQPVAPAVLLSLIERIERLNGEKKVLSDDIKSIYDEAKGRGFDTKIVRAVIRLRSMEDHERVEHQELLDTYCKALGL